MRVPGWQRKLNDYMYEAQARYQRDGLVWGSLDCAHFIGDWCEILTGTDPLDGYRGAYSNEEEAFALLRSRDRSLYQALRSRFGNPVHPAKAQRGDIAYRKDDRALGIFFTSGPRMMAIFLADGGFTLHRLQDIDYAFTVR